MRAITKDSQDDLPHPTNWASDTAQPHSTSVQPPGGSKASESELSTHVRGKHKRNIKAKDGKKGKKQKKQEKIQMFLVSDNDDEEDKDKDGKDKEEEEEENEEKVGNDNEDPDNSEGPLATAPTRHSTRLKSHNLNTITPSEEASTLTHMSTVAAPAVQEQSLPLLPLTPRSMPPVPHSPLAPPSMPSSGPTGTTLGCGPASPSQPTQSTMPLPVPTLICQPSTRPSPPLITPQTLPKPPIPTQSMMPLPVPMLICQPSTQPSPPLIAPQRNMAVQ